MKYTLRFVAPNGNFYYPQSISAHLDSAGNVPDGSYLIMFLTKRISDAMVYDNREEADSLMDIDYWIQEAVDGAECFDLIGTIRIPTKALFKKRLEDK